MAVQARAFWLREPGAGEIRSTPCADPGPGEVLVRTLRTGVSRGTETLVFRGGVPADQRAVMRAPHQEGDLPGPVKYGYLNVGVVEAGPPNLLGPHRLLPLPPPELLRRAGRARSSSCPTTCRPTAPCSPAPSRPPSTPCGMPRRSSATASPWWGPAWWACVARLLTGIPGVEVTVVDVDPARAAVARRWGADFALPADAPDRLRPGRARERDLGRAAARARRARAGGHRARPQLVRRLRGDPAPRRVVPLEPAVGAGQPGRHGVAGAARSPHRTPTGCALALRLLRDPAFDVLLTGSSPFDELPDVMARLADGTLPALCHTMTYPEETAVFSVTVRDHMMIAHSLRGEVFGPAQRLHGATYVVDATVRAAGPRRRRARRRHRPGGPGAAAVRRRAELPQPRRRPVARRASTPRPNGWPRSWPTGSPSASHAGDLGRDAGELASLLVTLRESHVAWASYERDAVTPVHVVVPDGVDDPARPSGGNTYDRRLCAGLSALGWDVHVDAVRPENRCGRTVFTASALCGGAGRASRPAPLCCSTASSASDQPEVLRAQAGRLRLVVLVHLPLGLGGPDGGAPSVRAREAAALRCVAEVVTTSRWTRHWLLDAYGLDPAAGHRRGARRRGGPAGGGRPGRPPAALRRGGDPRQGTRRAPGGARPGHRARAWALHLRRLARARPGLRRAAARAGASSWGSRTGCGSPARWAEPSSTPPTPTPTSSSPRRAARPTGWRSPRRSPTASRCWRPGSAASRRRGSGTRRAAARHPGTARRPRRARRRGGAVARRPRSARAPAGRSRGPARLAAHLVGDHRRGRPGARRGGGLTGSPAGEPGRHRARMSGEQVLRSRPGEEPTTGRP